MVQLESVYNTQTINAMGILSTQMDEKCCLNFKCLRYNTTNETL